MLHDEFNFTLINALKLQTNTGKKTIYRTEFRNMTHFFKKRSWKIAYILTIWMPFTALCLTRIQIRIAQESYLISCRNNPLLEIFTSKKCINNT